MTDETGQITRIRPTNNAGIRDAIARLDAGEVVAIPTETVYGLGADAANGEAVARIYAAKERPRINPLIVHVADMRMASRYAPFPPLARQLAARFWPGPLTLVLQRHPDAPVASLLLAGLETIALRIPSHGVMQRLLHEFDRGIAAPSANRSGCLSPTRAEHVFESLHGRIPLILDGGPAASGIESTILAIDGEEVRLLRPGAIETAAIEAVIGIEVLPAGAKVTAPGMSAHHYAPQLPLRLQAETAAADEFHIGFGEVAGDESLSRSGNSVEAASRLYDLLFRADRSGQRAIAVAPIADDGLGLAINDRLRRAAR